MIGIVSGRNYRPGSDYSKPWIHSELNWSTHNLHLLLLNLEKHRFQAVLYLFPRGECVLCCGRGRDGIYVTGYGGRGGWLWRRARGKGARVAAGVVAGVAAGLEYAGACAGDGALWQALQSLPETANERDNHPNAPLADLSWIVRIVPFSFAKLGARRSEVVNEWCDFSSLETVEQRREGVRGAMERRPGFRGALRPQGSVFSGFLQSAGTATDRYGATLEM